MITILTSWFKTVDIVTWHIQDSKGALNDQMQEDSQATLNEQISENSKAALDEQMQESSKVALNRTWL